MPRIVIVAGIEDATKWEEGFRSHGELFKKQTVTTCHYTVRDDEVAACFEADDLDTYMRILNSPETEKAMAHDGIKRDTVKIFTLDNQFTP